MTNGMEFYKSIPQICFLEEQILQEGECHQQSTVKTKTSKYLSNGNNLLKENTISERNKLLNRSLSVINLSKHLLPLFLCFSSLKAFFDEEKKVLDEMGKRGNLV